MATVTKKQLIDQIAERTGTPRPQVRRVLQCALDTIVERLAEGCRLELRDFGVFKVKARQARVARNPRTLASVAIPAKRAVCFKVGRLMRQRLEAGAQSITEVKPSAPARRARLNGRVEPRSDAPV
jgi:nucleoid DNA-binding protein